MNEKKLEKLIDEALKSLEEEFTEEKDKRFLKLMSNAERYYGFRFVGGYCERYNKIIQKYGDRIFK